jgi:hypothetical protein
MIKNSKALFTDKVFLLSELGKISQIQPIKFIFVLRACDCAMLIFLKLHIRITYTVRTYANLTDRVGKNLSLFTQSLNNDKLTK